MSGLQNELEIEREDDVVPSEPLSLREELAKAAASFEEKDTAPKTDDKPRDETGKFVAAKPAEQKQEAQQLAPATQPIGQPAAVVPVVEAPKPPPGWAPEAKADFANLPPHVQAAIVKREQEVDNGFKVLQDYKGLDEFTPLIKHAGTTHAEVMRKAIDWEKSLKADPVNTVLHVARISGVDIVRLAQMVQQNPQAAQQMQQPAPQPQINVEQTVEQVLRKRDTETQVQSFLADPKNTHAEAVIDDMVALINAGRAKDLQSAYDMATWMRPDIREQLINQAAPQQVQPPKAPSTDQARKASKSITGSSAPGPSKDAGATAPSSIRDELRQAMAAAGTRA